MGNRKWVHSSRNRLYAVWNSMCKRCNNPNHKSYQYYGGKGITVCEEWLSYDNFYEWAYENGYNPLALKGECTIDRINTNKGYAPENCRWVDMKTQNNNSTNNVLVDNEVTLSEYLRDHNISYNSACVRELRNSGRLHKRRSKMMVEGKSLLDISLHTDTPYGTLVDRYKRGARTLKDLLKPVDIRHRPNVKPSNTVYIEGMTYQQISDKYHIPVPTLRNRYRYGYHTVEELVSIPYRESKGRPIKIKIAGKSLRQLSEESGIPLNIISQRYQCGDRTVERLTRPVRKRRS